MKLTDLIGTEFSVGPVRMRGLRPCPPCLYLSQLLNLPILLRGLAHSGGIYASILSGGPLSDGDLLLPQAIPQREPEA